MSLRGFHILFIVLSALACFGSAWWCFASPNGSVQYPTTGLAAGVLGAALVVYGISFFRKLLELR